MTYFKSTRSFKSSQFKSWSRSSLSQKSFQVIVKSSRGSAKSSQVMTCDLNDLTSMDIHTRKPGTECILGSYYIPFLSFQNQGYSTYSEQL